MKMKIFVMSLPNLPFIWKSFLEDYYNRKIIKSKYITKSAAPWAVWGIVHCNLFLLPVNISAVILCIRNCWLTPVIYKLENFWSFSINSNDDKWLKDYDWKTTFNAISHSWRKSNYNIGNQLFSCFKGRQTGQLICVPCQGNLLYKHQKFWGY